MPRTLIEDDLLTSISCKWDRRSYKHALRFGLFAFHLDVRACQVYLETCQYIAKTSAVEIWTEPGMWKRLIHQQLPLPRLPLPLPKTTIDLG